MGTIQVIRHSPYPHLRTGRIAGVARSLPQRVEQRRCYADRPGAQPCGHFHSHASQLPSPGRVPSRHLRASPTSRPYGNVAFFPVYCISFWVRAPSVMGPDSWAGYRSFVSFTDKDASIIDSDSLDRFLLNTLSLRACCHGADFLAAGLGGQGWAQARVSGKCWEGG